MQMRIQVEPSVPPNAKEYVVLLNSLTTGFVVAVPLKEIHYVQTQASPPLYQYDFEAYDGREWHQRIDYLNGFSGDPVLSLPTDGATERWKVTEFQQHIEFREVIVALTRKFGITAVHIEWVP